MATLTALAVATSLGCASFGSAPEDDDFVEMPSAEELYQEGLAKLADGGKVLWIFDTTDYQGAIDKFQDIADNYPYSDYATLAELRIADAFFQQESWEEAVSYYRDFAELHPDHEKVPYTIYQAAMAHYKRSRTAGRDQTPTKKAIDHLDRLITEYPHAPETADAEIMWRELRTRLGKHVIGIADFYLDRSEYQSAADRYRSVLNEYPGLGLDAEALYKLGVCYSNMSLEDEAQRVFQVILENYEGSEIADAAQEWVPSAN
ncbi:MAG: outer membrane protein assembly factor BamD [Myxococcota bacterium]|nr:outer membrane protein assembly factor BamD [Myxococcota bacterium]